MYNISDNSEFTGQNQNNLEVYLAKVTKVYKSTEEIKGDSLLYNISVSVNYNINNKYKDKDPDIRFLGAVKFQKEDSIELIDYALPFDKNNITFPIVGETVLIMNIGMQHFWLPFSNTQYPNYR